MNKSVFIFLFFYLIPSPVISKTYLIYGERKSGTTLYIDTVEKKYYMACGFKGVPRSVLCLSNGGFYKDSKYIYFVDVKCGYTIKMKIIANGFKTLNVHPFLKNKEFTFSQAYPQEIPWFKGTGYRKCKLEDFNPAKELSLYKLPVKHPFVYFEFTKDKYKFYNYDDGRLCSYGEYYKQKDTLYLNDKNFNCQYKLAIKDSCLLDVHFLDYNKCWYNYKLGDIKLIDNAHIF